MEHGTKASRQIIQTKRTPLLGTELCEIKSYSALQGRIFGHYPFYKKHVPTLRSTAHSEQCSKVDYGGGGKKGRFSWKGVESGLVEQR